MVLDADARVLGHRSADGQISAGERLNLQEEHEIGEALLVLEQEEILVPLLQ